MDFPYKKPATQKAFPCDDGILDIIFGENMNMILEGLYLVQHSGLPGNNGRYMLLFTIYTKNIGSASSNDWDLRNHSDN